MSLTRPGSMPTAILLPSNTADHTWRILWQHIEKSMNGKVTPGMSWKASNVIITIHSLTHSDKKHSTCFWEITSILKVNLCFGISHQTITYTILIHACLNHTNLLITLIGILQLTLNHEYYQIQGI